MRENSGTTIERKEALLKDYRSAAEGLLNATNDDYSYTDLCNELDQVHDNA